ncbi:hypothetical protein BD560DRAFT_409410, partial [Blakeslea trispora]
MIGTTMQIRLRYDKLIKCLIINHHTLPAKKSLVVGITRRPGSRGNPLLYLAKKTRHQSRGVWNRHLLLQGVSIYKINKRKKKKMPLQAFGKNKGQDLCQQHGVQKCLQYTLVLKHIFFEYCLDRLHTEIESSYDDKSERRSNFFIFTHCDLGSSA